MPSSKNSRNSQAAAVRRGSPRRTALSIPSSPNLGAHIRRVLEVRDYICHRLEHGMTLNAFQLAAEFDMSPRHARRYMKEILAHLSLPVRYNPHKKSFELER